MLYPRALELVDQIVFRRSVEVYAVEADVHVLSEASLEISKCAMCLLTAPCIHQTAVPLPLLERDVNEILL